MNVLVNSANGAIITDFGSARPLGCVFSLREGFETAHEHRQNALDQKEVSVQTEISQSGTFITMTGPKWTLRWAAPELLHGGLPNLASDIWAFGWICWEVCGSSSVIGKAVAERRVGYYWQAPIP